MSGNPVKLPLQVRDLIFARMRSWPKDERGEVSAEAHEWAMLATLNALESLEEAVYGLVLAERNGDSLTAEAYRLWMRAFVDAEPGDGDLLPLPPRPKGLENLDRWWLAVAFDEEDEEIEVEPSDVGDN